MNKISFPSTVEQKDLFSHSGLPDSYLWQNMKIEKLSTTSWVKWAYKDNIFGNIWTLLTSSIR